MFIIQLPSHTSQSINFSMCVHHQFMGQSKIQLGGRNKLILEANPFGSLDEENQHKATAVLLMEHRVIQKSRKQHVILGQVQSKTSGKDKENFQILQITNYSKGEIKQ